MFEIKINTLDKTVLTAFGNFFAELAQRASSTAQTMSATEYVKTIDNADNPATGVNIPDGVTMKSAAEVFGGNSPARSTAGANQTETAQGEAQGNSVESSTLTAAQVFGNAGSTVADPTPDIAPAPLDSTGIPWDVRIHSSSRGKNNDGTWKAKRNVDAALRAAVEAELHQAMAAPKPPFQPLHTAPPPPPPAAGATSTVAQDAKAPPPPAPSPSENNAPVINFKDLCRYVADKRIAAPRILEVCQRYGLPGLGLAATRTDLIPHLYADFVSGN